MHETALDSRRWKHRPQGSNWGDYGADDQLGRLNLLTAEGVRRAAAEVREGLVFCLSLPLDYPGGNILNPRRLPPVLKPTTRNAQPNFNYRIDNEAKGFRDVICDDYVVLYLQYSTQWDGLAHQGCVFDADGDGTPEVVYYNGYRAHEHILGPHDRKPSETDGVGERSCARALGIENMAVKGVQGRGVLIDLYKHFGLERKLVCYSDLRRIMESDRIVVESGDMVCLHTGFANMLLEMKGRPDPDKLHTSCAVLDGHDEALQNWIIQSGLSVLISDNYAVEAVPAREKIGSTINAPLHELCIFKLGIHLGELWYLTDLCRWLQKKGRYRFLLTAPPLRLPGAAGSPLTPIATV